MKLDVYDTYATSAKGDTIHFDVFLPSGENKAKALTCANNFLEEIGKPTNIITLDRCNFCHIETANPDVKQQVETDGYFILNMEGCLN